MSEIVLGGLRGGNPLGFLAALGALDVATRRSGGQDAVGLRWREELEPAAVLRCPWTADELIAEIDADRRRWQDSLVLHGSRGRDALADIKPSQEALRVWANDLLDQLSDGPSPVDRAEVDLFCALLAEGAVAGKGDAKPTYLHFTAGQQKFLAMVRDLATKVNVDHLREALFGPWTYSSELPVLGWDIQGERLYALRGTQPSSEKKTGVPGADWLAFLGLTFFPVFASRYLDRPDYALRTVGCAASWKDGSFTWPLWSPPLTAAAVRTLVGQLLGQLTSAQRALSGITAVLRAPIRRAEQGGYGSFGSPETVLPALPRRQRVT